MSIVKVNATVKMGGVAFSLTKTGGAFSLTNEKHGLFVDIEGIVKAPRTAIPLRPEGDAFSLTNILPSKEAANGTFERRRPESTGTLPWKGSFFPQHCGEFGKESEYDLAGDSESSDFEPEGIGVMRSERLSGTLEV